jgi:hypothetical protein
MSPPGFGKKATTGRDNKESISEMCFDDDILIKKYGSWVRVQVAFYDFIFQEALKLCPQHAKESFLEGFADGKDPYEDAVKAIEKRFKSFADAMTKFKTNAKPKQKIKKINET